MGLRTCKRCGKQYDPSKANTPLGCFCSSRCSMEDMKQKQKEAEQKAKRK